jgi:hypothetical protein
VDYALNGDHLSVLAINAPAVLCHVPYHPIPAADGVPQLEPLALAQRLPDHLQYPVPILLDYEVPVPNAAPHEQLFWRVAG